MVAADGSSASSGRSDDAEGGVDRPGSSPATRRLSARAPVGSGRSITDLELAFAQHPESDVYVELCHAYLGKRRFMEAMVVCKKAVRTHPEALVPKLLLARVHEAQERLQRARDVLEPLAESHADDAELQLALGRVWLASDEEGRGVDAMKRALDLEPALEEASQALELRGIAYPPPPPAPPSTQDLQAELPPGGVAVAGLPPLPATGDLAGGLSGPHLSGAHPSMGSQISGAFPAAGGSGVYRIPRQRLEGEDELERLAEEVAKEEPPRGRPRTTFLLLAVLLMVSVAVVAVRFAQKNTLEAIDRISTDADTDFDRDLYGSYKSAARNLEQILTDLDSDHGPTAALLAHSYAILLTEHLATDVQARLQEVLTLAEAVAPEDPNTRAARALLSLGTGSSSLETVVEELLAHAGTDQQALPTYVDLTLGIAEREVGELEQAHRRLRKVADFLSGNVRARVWSARAAASAGRLATAHRAFVQARKAEPRHPGALSGLALVTLARGELEAARQALSAFDALEAAGGRDISPKDRALAVFAKSELHRLDGETNAADVEYDQATKLDPENADFPYQRGRGLLGRDQLEGAIEYLGKAVSMEDTRWTYRVELAEALMQAKRYPEAKVHIDYAQSKAPSELGVALAQARYLRRSKDPTTEAFLLDLKSRFPGAKVEVNLELGRLHRSQGKLDQADQELGEAIESFGGRPPGLQADVLVSFGLVASDAKRSEEAAKAYRQAVRRGSLEAMALLASMLQSGDAAARQEALTVGKRYLAAGEGLRRTAFVRAIVARLEGG